jgi:uncharacterized membrane protein HdeD (DUF308 family)
MGATSSAEDLQVPLRKVKRATTWYIVAAVLFIMLGMFSIIEPTVAALGVTLLVGWLLVFGGLAHFVGAFRGGGAKRVIFQVLTGIVYVIGGLYFVSHPLLGIGTLTLLLAAFILVGGVLEIVSFFRLRGEAKSGWILFNGVIELLLGGMIWFHWPSSSVWAIGILVGVTLVFTGMTRLMVGLAARKLMSAASQ